jgi:protein-S-isoprenylcysteine O-methyltransferase Ste14
MPVGAAGAVVIAVGVAVFLHGFARFVVGGVGTPVPLAPPERLVVGGLCRYVRNPMCLAVGAVIVGQALLFGYPGLLLYAAAFCGAVCAFVYGYEEPTLADRCGAQYDAYPLGRAGLADVPRDVPNG